MAYLNKQIPEDEQNKLGSTAPTTVNPLPQSGGSTGSASQGRAAPGVASSTQFGSNAAKLSDYLTANKPQVADFGNKIAGDLTQGYNQTKSNIDSGFGKFGEQVNQGFTPGDDSLVKSASENPTDFVKNPDNVSKFKSMFNDTYSGPQNFESSDVYGGLNNDVNKSVEKAGLVNSTGGLSSYLNNYGGSSNNTPGMTALDTALLQRSPEASSAIKNAAQPYGGLTGYLSGKTNEANQNVANAKTSADQVKSQTQNKFVGDKGIVPTLQSDLTNRLTQAQGNYGTQYAQAVNGFKGGSLTPDQAKFLGINPNSMSDKPLLNANQWAGNLRNDYGINSDLSNYFTSPDATAIYSNENTVATPDELAKAQALNMLTGQNAGLDLNGPLGVKNQIQINRPGLEQLQTQLTDQDQQALLKYPGPMGLNPGYDFGSAVSVLQQQPWRIPEMITAAQKSSNQEATVLKNALQRLGIQIPGTPPPPTTGGGVASAWV